MATGAHERPIVFADNDRPGIMLAGGARTFLHRYGVLVGRAAVVFTTNDSAYAAAVDLADAGVEVPPSSTPGRRRPRRWRRRCASRGIPVRAGQVVTGTDGVERITAALVAPLATASGEPRARRLRRAAGQRRLEPRRAPVQPGPRQTALRRRARGVRARGASWPGRVAGAAAGVFDLAGWLARAAGGRRGADELGVAGRRGHRACPPSSRARAAAPNLVLWRVPDPAGRRDTQFVDLQRDATVADIARAVGAGMRSVEHIKRYTTIGTAHDQGKTSGVIASGITAELLGGPIEELGTTTFRPPYTPVAFAALAGRDRGALFDPSAPPPSTPGTSSRARYSRMSGSGSAPGTTRSPARTWRPRSCGNARPPAPGSASWTARPWARSTCRARTPRRSWTCSTRT